MRRDVFQAIADPIRRDIIDLLAEETLTLNFIAQKFDISRPAVSKHVKILRECGIVEIHQKGRRRYCQIRPRNLVPAFMWLEQHRVLWEGKLNSFANYINKLQSKTTKNERK